MTKSQHPVGEYFAPPFQKLTPSTDDQLLCSQCAAAMKEPWRWQKWWWVEGVVVVKVSTIQYKFSQISRKRDKFQLEVLLTRYIQISRVKYEFC